MFLPFIGFGQSGNFGEKTGNKSGWIYGSGNGQGKYKWQDGRSEEGNFKNSKLNGKGVFTYASGKYYTGDFLYGKMHGQGIMRNNKDFILQKGKWINGVYQKPKTSNTSTWKPPVKAVCNRKSKIAIAE